MRGYIKKVMFVRVIIVMGLLISSRQVMAMNECEQLFWDTNLAPEQELVTLNSGQIVSNPILVRHYAASAIAAFEGSKAGLIKALPVSKK